MLKCLSAAFVPLAILAGCTAVSEDATRSNCKLAQDALDLANAAVFEYQEEQTGQSVPAVLTESLAAAKLTQALVCG